MMKRALATAIPSFLLLVALALIASACAESEVSLGGEESTEGIVDATSSPPATAGSTPHQTENGDPVLPTEAGTREPLPPRSSIPDPDELDQLPDNNQLETGEICRRDGQCESGLCARLEAGVPDGVCTTTCREDANCPESWECILIRTSGLDAEFICLDPFFCIDRDGDGYGVGPGCAGPDCDDTDPDRFFGAISRCDGKDNNCNGIIDDFPVVGEFFGEEVEMGEPCDTGSPGICGAGIFICDNGEVRCQGLSAPREEVCNGLDDNCDGTIDSGNPGGGLPCGTEFPGVCSIGTTSCENGRLDCIPTISPFSRDESCNFQDDNCDGTVDTGFRNSEGVYDQVEHCGACGINCNNFWPGGAANFGVRPVCSVDAGLATCDYECLPGFVDADGVAENGCELQPDEGAIYVARPISGGVDDGNCGTWDAPCATIGHGIVRAGSRGAERVRIADGVFRENVTLANGISLLGGHNSTNWVRQPDVFTTILTGLPSGSGPDRIALRAEGITSPTTVEGLTINAVNAAAGGNSIAIYVLNSDQNLEIRNNQIFAARGGEGTPGAAGATGLAGLAGPAGNSRLINSAPEQAIAPARSCPNLRASGTINVAGGSGGASLTPNPTSPINNSTQRSGPGANGNGTSPGSGGLGGGHMAGTSAPSCTVPAVQIDPDPGTDGAPGSDGSGGSRNDAANGTVTGGLWRGLGGGDGVAGTPGSGGGGGGAAAGVLVSSSTRYFGATGGAGGSGGCAGDRGQGGSAGGGSFGIFITQSTSVATSALPVIRDNQITRGLGAPGGTGGAGGQGEVGGAGGAGGLSARAAGLNATYDFCMFAGGRGGFGGRGGHGGGGAGGNGGASFDIFVHNASPRAAYTNANQFSLPDSEATGGAGGSGGVSSNTSGGAGQTGATGPSGNVGSL